MIKAIQIAYDTLFELKCRLAAEAGFDGIAVNFDAAKGLTDEEWDRAVDRISQILERVSSPHGSK